VIRALAKNSRPDDINQYEVAMIYHLGAVIGEETFHSAWKRLGRDRAGNDPVKNLLGAIVLSPDREIVQNVTSLSSHSGSNSHPIFDKEGVLRFPENVKNNID
jgi:hypothetical protein